MHLYKAHVENFRSIKNSTIDLKKCTILVGMNNTGKSNFLKALDLVLGEGYIRVTKNDFFNQDENNTIKITLYFNRFSREEIDAIKEEIRYNVNINGVYYRKEEIQGELESKKEIRMEVEIFSDNVERKLYIGDLYYKYFSNKLRNTIVNTIYVPSVRDIGDIMRMTRYTLMGKLLKIIYEKADKTKKAELESILRSASGKTKEIFEECEKKLNEISKTIIEHDGLSISMLPSDYRDIYKKLNLLLNDGIESELEYKGTGIQSVIIICLFKLYADLKIGNSILIIEEPESYLHPHANRYMAKILKNICYEQNMQIIFSTHSPYYILEMDIKDVVLFTKKNIESKTKQITVIKNETKLKKELNADNLELFFSDKAILVEGITEKLLLPTLSKQINPNYNFDLSNISIIEVGSKSNLDIFIDLLNSFNIPWMAILDRDFISKTESLGLMKKINDTYRFGFDIETTTESDLIESFKKYGLYTLSYGEIENYYNINWLTNIIFSYLEDLKLDTHIEEKIRDSINEIDIDTDIDSLKRDLFTSITFDEYELKIINNLINIKNELIRINLNNHKIGKKLEKIFEKVYLTKPRIAVRISEYIDINALDVNKRNDLIEIIGKIFT